MYKQLKVKIVKIIVATFVIIVISSVIALIFNMLRYDGIPLITDIDYDIYVPCPEPSGKIEEIKIEEAAKYIDKEKILFIDARSNRNYKKGHIKNSLNIKFSYLDAIDKEIAKKLVKKRPKKIIVYGEIDVDVDTGEELASEISALGINNVYYINGNEKEIKKYLVNKK